MNVKLVNLVAVQFGIFVGIMAWLAFTRLESTKSRPAAEMPENVRSPIATVAPAFKPRSPRPYTVDYGADRDRAQPEIEEQAQMEQDYDQEIAAQPYAGTELENNSIVEPPPSSTQVNQEPAVASSDYLEPPQAIADAEPAPVVVYSQPQFVVFSSRRSLARRYRPAPRPGVFPPIPQQQPKRQGAQVNGCGIAPRPNAGVPSGRPNQGFRPRGHR